MEKHKTDGNGATVRLLGCIPTEGRKEEYLLIIVAG